MIYCPKCGNSTDQHAGAGNAALSCSSCGVAWSDFLKSMANDSLWPDIVKRDKHDIICPKCGYERFTSDDAKSRTTCPDCRVSYADFIAGRSPNVRDRIDQQSGSLPNQDISASNTQTGSSPPAFANAATPNALRIPVWQGILKKAMKQRWTLASIAICILALIAYTELRQMRLAEQQAEMQRQQAEIQKQQVKLAEEEAERIKRLDDQAKLDKKLADIKVYYDRQRYLLDVQNNMELDRLKVNRQIKYAEELERKAGVPWAKPAN